MTFLVPSAWANAPAQECSSELKGATVVPKLTSTHVISIASASAKAQGLDLSKFQPPRVCFDSASREWTVHFEGLSEKGVMVLDNWFRIRVDDATRRAKFFGAA
ncbi:hypothetical protein [Usitatibacter rugosus]|uniref:hypothetical protein n=1 Tax=Usitatibacter rugosus TaxID=2732067 RepID=UPI001487F7CE|nr:hypothetical protein [Usitatibacter rugosus]